MPEVNVYKKLLKTSGLMILGAFILMMISYFFLDRPVVNFIYSNKINSNLWLMWPTYIPTVLITLSAFALVFCLIFRAYRPEKVWTQSVYLMSLAIVFAEFFNLKLKVVFGRYWPQNWKNNLSFIQDKVYGFNFFEGDGLNNSFPSGHSALTFAAMGVLWLLFPKARGAVALVCLLVIFGLIGMNYHFISDIIAGATVGSICALYTVRLNK